MAPTTKSSNPSSLMSPAHETDCPALSSVSSPTKLQRFAAAIDRLVHHAAILEIDRGSIRAEDAERRGKRRSDEKEDRT